MSRGKLYYYYYYKLIPVPAMRFQDQALILDSHAPKIKKYPDQLQHIFRPNSKLISRPNIRS